MDIVRKCRITIDFDVWEPTAKHVQTEIDKIILFTRHELNHAGNVRVSTVEVLSEKKL